MLKLCYKHAIFLDNIGGACERMVASWHYRYWLVDYSLFLRFSFIKIIEIWFIFILWYSIILIMQASFETICPLTKKVMRNPVMIENGKNFEYDALMKIFGRGKYVDPTTNKPLKSNKVFPNIALASLIRKQGIGETNGSIENQLKK